MFARLAAVWAVLIAGACATLLGGYVMYAEARPNFLGGTTPVTRIAAMSGTEDATGLSVLTQRHVLLDCEQALRSEHALELRYLDPAVGAQLPATCRLIAEGLAAHNPADAFAWFVGAAASARMNDGAAFSAALARSEALAPNEGWLTKMRTDRGEQYFAMLTPEAIPAHNRDLALTAGNGRYASDVARIYLADESMRARMDKVLETMPPEAQRTFLNAVRGLLNRRGQ